MVNLRALEPGMMITFPGSFHPYKVIGYADEGTTVILHRVGFKKPSGWPTHESCDKLWEYETLNTKEEW
jgi:hypothetical protein